MEKITRTCRQEAMVKCIGFLFLIGIFVTAESRVLLPGKLIEGSEDMKVGETKGFSEASNEDPLLLPRKLIEGSEDMKEGETKGFSEASNEDLLLLPRKLIEGSEDMKEGETKGFSEASNEDPWNPIGDDPRHN